MRRFELWRTEDETGISGTGRVATGVQFPDGECVMRWNTATTSTAIYRSVEDLEAIHGHGGKTKVVFLDYEKEGHGGGGAQDLTPICCLCFGGPPYDDGVPCFHCIDCGAGGAIIYIPRWAQQDIRRKDKQRLDSVQQQRRELRLLRAKLPVPDFVKVEKLTPPRTPEEQVWWAREVESGYFETHWNVSIGNTSTVIKAETKEEARALGAISLSWLPYLDEGE